MISVLVVDDTILYRKLVSDILATIPEVRVVGTASNGKIALSRIALLKPDLVTLDVEMPEMNGIEVLQEARKAEIGCSFLMVSALTKQGAELSLRALELGALDVVPKSDGEAITRDAFTLDLRTKVEALARRGEIHKILNRGQTPRGFDNRRLANGELSSRGLMAQDQRGFGASGGASAGGVDQRPLSAGSMGRNRTGSPIQKPEVLAIGVSTGGPAALMELIPALPGNLPVPVVIVQHMPPLFTASLAKSLEGRGKLPVKEGENGEVVRPGVVYIAPGGSQMRIDLGADAITKIIRITSDPPENNCRPSVDYLFRSVARHFYGRALGVVMTGMGEDGAQGAGEIQKAGGEILVQDEDTSVVWGMPGAVVQRGFADGVYPLPALAREITKRIL